MTFLRTWLWERSAFMLSIFVLGSLIGGWLLPGSYQVVLAMVYAQIALAIIVAIREGMRLSEARR